jgi:hypothetical protein
LFQRFTVVVNKHEGQCGRAPVRLS